jgi:endonuclease/exonuclease/phosphatase (EEP) superfamily protein YafD
MAVPGEGDALKFERLILAVVAALWSALLVGLAGRYAWPLDLFAHFRVQYAVALAAAAIVLLVRRRWLPAGAASAGALLAAVPLAAYVGLPAAPAKADSVHFRVVSYNIWYRNADLGGVAAWLEQSGADVIVVQELTPQRARRMQPLLRTYPHAYFHPQEYGAVIFSRWPFLSTESVMLTDAGARGTHVVLDWHGTRVGLVGVHLHWPLGANNSRLRNAELEGLAGLARTQREPLIVSGDFNITPWSAHFRAVLQRSGLNDCAQGRGLLPTWPSQFPPLGIAIDHCLASREWQASDLRTGPALGSDHRALIADLSLPASARPQSLRATR